MVEPEDWTPYCPVAWIERMRDQAKMKVREWYSREVGGSAAAAAAHVAPVRVAPLQPCLRSDHRVVHCMWTMPAAQQSHLKNLLEFATMEDLL